MSQETKGVLLTWLAHKRARQSINSQETTLQSDVPCFDLKNLARENSSVHRVVR
jgi:hypothetical protein